jgi:hypothetical protein
MSARLRWIVAVAAVLALIAQAWAATAVWNHTRPRLPALAAVAPLLDKAIAATVSATGDRAAVAIAGVVAYTGCEKTFLAKGSRFNRVADLYTDPGTEDALIATVADRLPADDHPTRTTPIGGGAAPLTADLGSGVHLRLSQLGDGWLQAVAETDCRTGHPHPEPAPAADPPGKDTVDHLLTALGTATDTWHTDTIACPGGPLTTLSAISRTADTGNLPRRLATLAPADAHRFASPSNRLAWHDTTGSTIVAASDDGTHITVQHTTPC